jgi:hypothetical protein
VLGTTTPTSTPTTVTPPVPSTTGPSSTVPSDGGTPFPLPGEPASATDGGDTSSGPAPGGRAVTPGVLEISDKSGDDQATGRSFTTSDGVSL